nr:zinc finger, CCHC-type, retrotransposon Gag domain protein [Tanacetum cinerariifolium]
DAFKTRLAVYKFEGNALAWSKAYKQAKGGDAWLVTMTWADFKKLFSLQFFPRAEQERLKREYHSIRQKNTETSTEFMQRFLRLAGFLGAAAGTEEEQAKNFQWCFRRSTLNHLMCMSYTDLAQVANATRNYEILHERDDDDTERPDKRGVVIGISRSLSRVVTGATVIITTVRDRTGVVVVTTITAATTTATTLAVTTGIPVMDGTRETGVISPTDLPILALSNPGVPLRVTPIQFALLVDVDTKENVVELQVLASSVVKLAIYKKIAGRTPLQAHLVRLTRSQPTTQQGSHRNHGHNNDRHGLDRNSGNRRDQRNRGQQSNRSANSGRGVVIGSSRPLSRVVTRATVIITTVMDLTGEVVVTTTAATTTTTLAVTTGIPIMDVTRETGVNSPTNLPIL